MTNDSELLFAYGTLADSTRLQRLAGGPVRCLGRARTRGRLRRAGRYPQLIPGGRTWVEGRLFRLQRPNWGTLDRYEGCPPAFRGRQAYQRRLIPVIGPGGHHFSAWAYVAADTPQPRRRNRARKACPR